MLHSSCERGEWEWWENSPAGTQVRGGGGQEVLQAELSSLQPRRVPGHPPAAHGHCAMQISTYSHGGARGGKGGLCELAPLGTCVGKQESCLAGDWQPAEVNTTEVYIRKRRESYKCFQWYLPSPTIKRICTMQT